MEKIKREVTQTEAYVVYGEKFFKEKDAVKYKQEMDAKLGSRFYIVNFGFDYTEGSGYYKHEIVAIKENKFGHIQDNAIIAYCLENHGDPVRNFYNRAQDNWNFSKKPEKFDTVEDLNTFISRHEGMNRGYNHKFKGVVYCNEFGVREEQNTEAQNDTHTGFLSIYAPGTK